MSASLTIAACIKWVDLHPVFDPIHGTVSPSERGGGFSPADLSAAETALSLADDWDAEAVLVCAGPVSAEGRLREVAASGFNRAIRIAVDGQLDSATVSELLVRTLGRGDVGADLIVCGDMSYDRSSGAVPATVAHHLDACQALGLLDVQPETRKLEKDGKALIATRRLDGGRRERIRIPIPAVISVEGGVASLRRAAMGASLAGATSASDSFEVRIHEGHVPADPPRTSPWRPRARTLASPTGDTAFERILELTHAETEHAPTGALEASPAEAASLIFEQLKDWGYLTTEEV